MDVKMTLPRFQTQSKQSWCLRHTIGSQPPSFVRQKVMALSQGWQAASVCGWVRISSPMIEYTQSFDCGWKCYSYRSSRVSSRLHTKLHMVMLTVSFLIYSKVLRLYATSRTFTEPWQKCLWLELWLDDRHDCSLASCPTALHISSIMVVLR